jgi:hypothetical protein
MQRVGEPVQQQDRRSVAGHGDVEVKRADADPTPLEREPR